MKRSSSSADLSCWAHQLQSVNVLTRCLQGITLRCCHSRPFVHNYSAIGLGDWQCEYGDIAMEKDIQVRGFCQLPRIPGRHSRTCCPMGAALCCPCGSRLHAHGDTISGVRLLPGPLLTNSPQAHSTVLLAGCIFVCFSMVCYGLVVQ